MCHDGSWHGFIFLQTIKGGEQMHNQFARFVVMKSGLLIKAFWIIAAVLWFELSGAKGTINPVLSSLPDRQWTALDNSALSAIGPTAVPCCNYGIGCELAGIFAFSGAALDTSRQQILIWGGGHNDYFGNQLLRFDINTLQWSEVTQPTSVCLFANPPNYLYTDGTPVSRHTYDHIGYITSIDSFLGFSGATADAPPFNNGSSYGDLWTFDLGAGQWQDRTAAQSGDTGLGLEGPGMSGEYDAVSDRWYQITSDGVWRLNLTTNQWTQVNTTGHPGIERSSVLDTKRRIIWTYGGDFGGAESLTAYDIENNTMTTVSDTNLPGETSGAGLTYDAANDHLVLFGGDRTVNSVFNYDISAAEWIEYAYSSGPPGTQRVYSRFMYDAVNQVFFLIDSTEVVWVWKNTLNGMDLIFTDDFE